MQLFVGTSGFSYKEWLGRFYPEKLPATDMLRYYAQHFRTVEINNTFYRMPAESMLEGWSQQVPDNFAFTLKEPIADKVGGHYTQTVTLPNKPCTNCTLQLMQIMTTQVPYDSFYYQCADIVIGDGSGEVTGGDGGGCSTSSGSSGGAVVVLAGLIARRRRRYP